MKKFLTIAAFASMAAMAFAENPAEVDEIELADETDGKVEITASAKGEKQLVSLVCEDATIAEVLRQFRKAVKANIVSCESTNMSRKVSMSLYDTPWEDSFRAVLGMGGMVMEDRNGIYYVAEEQAQSPVVRSRSFTLNHASAEDLAKLLNESFGEKDPKTGKLKDNVATVFQDANVVVIKGTDRTIRDCEEVIKAVDKAPQQVYIEARFVELTSSAMHKLGIDWSNLEGYSIGVKDLKFGMEDNYGRLANYGYKQTDAEGNTTRGSLVPDSIPTTTAVKDTIGSTEQEHSMEWEKARVFSGQLSAADFSVALSAFENLEDAKTFSNPRVIVSNGKEAQVDMTTKYPNVRVTSNRTGGISDSLDITAQIEQIPGEKGQMFANEVFFSWGITLSVTPRISADGLINVDIVPMISSRSDWAEVGSGNSAAENSVYSKYPVIDVQRLITQFTMKDGSTAVIGGLTRTTEDDVDSGIPYLREIPWIGQRLFGWKGRSKQQKEIIVFVTVGVANPEHLKKDAGLPKNAILGREYVEGRALEPGDRGGPAKAMKLDMREVEERRDEDAEKAKKAAQGPKKNVKKPAKKPVKKAESASAQGPVRKAAEKPAEEPAKKIRHGRIGEQ